MRFIVLIFSICVFSCAGEGVTIDLYSGADNEALSKKLYKIVSETADEIDGDELEALLDRYPSKDDIVESKDDSVYFEIHQILVNAVNEYDLLSPLYTISLNPKSGHYEFGVTSNNFSYYKHIYYNLPKEQQENYNKGGTLPEYEDENGTWLSAFYPIKNSKGKTVGILQGDLEISRGSYDSWLEQ